MAVPSSIRSCSRQRRCVKPSEMGVVIVSIPHCTFCRRLTFDCGTTVPIEGAVEQCPGNLVRKRPQSGASSFSWGAVTVKMTALSSRSFASAARYFHFSQSCSRVRRWVKSTRTDLGNKHMRIARLVCRLALPAAALLYGLHQAGAQGMGTPDARAACTPDAMRLCSEYVPDANRVRSCMMSKRSQLSHACRAAMAASHEMYRRRDRVYCQRHPRHCH